MPLPERVAEQRVQQKRAEESVSQEQAEQDAVRKNKERKLRKANIASFNKFSRKMKLTGGLIELVKAEGLEEAGIQTFPSEPVADKVELRLKWKGEPKRYYHEAGIATRSYGFFSLSIMRTADGNITVAGKEEEASFHESYLGGEIGRREFEGAVARAYLDPRWNKQHDLVILASEKPTPHSEG